MIYLTETFDTTVDPMDCFFFDPTFFNEEAYEVTYEEDID